MKHLLRLRSIALACFLMSLLPTQARQVTIDLQQRYGIHSQLTSPGELQARLRQAISDIKKTQRDGDTITLRFAAGRYLFSPMGADSVQCYISNHDQQNTPRAVGIYLNGLRHVVLDGAGANFVFGGRMLPIIVTNSANVTLRHFTIDFQNPHIAQAQIVKNEGAKGITFELSPEVQAELQDGHLYTKGEDWHATPVWGIVFERETKRIAYNTGDIFFDLRQGVTSVGKHRYHAAHWQDSRLAPGSIVAMRTWARPNPGIFLADNSDTHIEDVTIHYAEGMGVLAQACHNVSLTKLRVAPHTALNRYFSTQADATHFSGCSGHIAVTNSYFEGMMDDALNVHGMYLKVTGRKNDRTVTARYMHDQAWGFPWGKVGDQVQFVNGQTVEVIGHTNRIKSIRPIDQPSTLGAREYEITFHHKLDKTITPALTIGIENLTRTPSVDFCNNTVTNNRARGILINTPQHVEISENWFDHVSGTAILFSTDCGVWWESGRTAKVRIAHNRFTNALTSLYQFTDAVIAINPVIPKLSQQQTPFYGTGRAEDIVIENNLFETFDLPMIYAKSVDGMTVRHNTVQYTNSYPRYHSNTQPTRYEGCRAINSQAMNGTDNAQHNTAQQHL
ncbi:MAG: alpha-1,3-galactosidase B [Bacteroidales bacterium]|nr:alpha-1,3-galactosidase B [Bacteroidales bacterium]